MSDCMLAEKPGDTRPALTADFGVLAATDSTALAQPFATFYVIAEMFLVKAQDVAQ